MGKKKKKGGRSPAGSITRPDDNAQGTASLERGRGREVSSSADFIPIKLVAPNPNRSAEGGVPSVTLAELDAKTLGVGRGDEAFLLAEIVVTSSIVAAARCQVRIESSEGATKARVSPGRCRVYPASLSESLLRGNGAPIEEEDNPLLSPILTPRTPSKVEEVTPSTPSSSKSGFSFARGGGGDALITPPSQRTKNPISSPSPQRVPGLRHLCITVRSPLGQIVSSLLCCEATKVTVQPAAASDIGSSRSGSERVIQRLFLAHIVDRYIRIGETISLSFQGKPMELRVQSVEASSTTVLNDEMKRLSLEEGSDNNDESQEFVDYLRSVLCHKETLDCTDKTTGLRLYRSTYDTDVVLCSRAADDSQHTTPLATPEKMLAGLSTTLEKVRSLLITPLLQPELFTRMSLKAPRGVLLYGQSGVGKSSLAKQIVIDLQSKVHVMYVNGVAFQSQQTALVGEAEKRLSDLFKEAQQHAKHKPTLLVIDDIHLICPKRTGINPGADRLSATLLALIDGIGSTRENSRGFVILAVTSNPSLLDAALRRPGRLDVEVEVPIPDEASRAEILRLQLAQLGEQAPELSDDQMVSLSRMAKGFNGADCMLAIKEAFRSLAIRTSNQSTEDRFELARVSGEKLTIGDLEAAIRTTKPNSIKSLTVEIPHVKWSSIGGMETVKERLREAIELPLTHSHIFERLGVPPPRGVLLYGPPGCSKTLMARALATEGRMNFLAVKGPELLSKWLGESERSLASLFRRARLASPSIIFFDEIDAIASQRGSGDGSGGGERLLSQLLTELDGIHNSMSPSVVGKTMPRVVFVAATNRPDLLDKALMRPGRVDRMIYVGLPDKETRARIFELSLKSKAVSDDVNTTKLADEEVSGGFSGAEVVAICKNAALLALEEDDKGMAHSCERPKIRMRHLFAAADGLERQITPEMLEIYESFRRKTNA